MSIRRQPELTPYQHAFLGRFSAEKANLAFDEMVQNKYEIFEIEKELAEMERRAIESGDGELDDDTIELYREYLIMLGWEVVKKRQEFDEACAEAAEHIGPGTPGDLLLLQSAMGSEALADC